MRKINDMLMIVCKFLAVEDIGDSLDVVETLIAKHMNFEKSLITQEEKLKVRAYIVLLN